jgi:pimeloyl-ACP methyl ester carboxylesterase
MRTEAALHDGTSIPIHVEGSGPNLLVSLKPDPIEGPQAEAMRKWGVDPANGPRIIEGLADIARVIAFDYEGEVLARPKPETLTPGNVVADLLSIADAAGADDFRYYGYSWLAMVGLQLALSTDRLAALAIGGFPPIDGPYREMLVVTTAGWELATGARPSLGEDEWSTAYLEPDQQRQFMTLYELLQGFDDRAAIERIDVPRVCFVGSADAIAYGPSWGDVTVDLARPIIDNRSRLEALGWEVRVLDGLDHTQAMQAARVVPILRGWLTAAGGSPAIGQSARASS